jgi:SAM-dependent methyltransferase
VANKTGTEHILEERRRVWQSKEIVRRLYHRWYNSMAEELKPGPILELGAGSGHLKGFFTDTVSSDILYAPWLDAVLNAQELPFRDGVFNNILLFDVLHHFNEPPAFFSEADRVLMPGGRILLMEPYVSWASFPIYRFFHEEGMNWRVDPFKRDVGGQGDGPFQGNQAVPTLIFEKYRKRFKGRFPRLRIIREEKMDPFLYPMSGGFHNPSLCPRFLWPVMSRMEKLFRPLNRYLAFRIFLVIEKGP